MVNKPRSNKAARSAKATKPIKAVTLEYVEDRVIEYFSVRFNTRPDRFNKDTDCKTEFGFEDADWRSLSDVFNQLDWMKLIKSHLSRQEMQASTTVFALTKQIVKNAMLR